MSLTLKPASPRRGGSAFSLKEIARLLRLTFISGPFLLFTSPLSGKHALFMILLCAPALLLTLLLTVPPLLFNSPEQNAYYQFANAVNHDPARLVILALCAVCSVIALAVPASAPQPFTAVRS